MIFYWQAASECGGLPIEKLSRGVLWPAPHANRGAERTRKGDFVMMDNNCFLVDWLSFRCESMTEREMMDYLGLSFCEWVCSNGFYGYRKRFWCSGMHIHYDNPDVPGILVEMSGTGCRAFETFSENLRVSDSGEVCADWISIFTDILHRNDFIITRLDIAFDDKTGCIPLSRFCSDVMAGNFVSKFKSDTGIRLEAHPGNIGQTVYLGSPSSELRFRVYDKAFERGFTSVAVNQGNSISSTVNVSSALQQENASHWVRFEMQARRDRAFYFLQELEKAEYDIGNVFARVIANYFRIVKPSEDTNKRRWETADYWAALIGDVLPLSVWHSKDLEYNKSACERYVYKMAGNSVYALIELEGLEEFKKILIKNKSMKMPQRIQNMIATEKALQKMRGTV